MMRAFTATYVDTKTKEEVKKEITESSLSAAWDKALEICVSFQSHQPNGYKKIKEEDLTLHFTNIEEMA